MQATRRVDEVVEKEQVSIAPISSGGRRGHSFQTDNIFIFFFQKKKIESNLEGARAVCSNWGVASAKSFSATWSCSGVRGQHFDSFHSLISLKRLRPAHAKTNN